MRTCEGGRAAYRSGICKRHQSVQCKRDTEAKLFTRSDCVLTDWMAPKRKPDAKQHSLEEVTGQPATKKRTKKGALAKPEIKKDDTSTDDLVRAKLARKHGSGKSHAVALWLARLRTGQRRRRVMVACP